MSHFFHNNSIMEQKYHISSTTIPLWNKIVTFLPKQFHFGTKMSHFLHNNSILELKCHISSTTIPLWNKNITFLPQQFHYRTKMSHFSSIYFIIGYNVTILSYILHYIGYEIIILSIKLKKMLLTVPHWHIYSKVETGLQSDGYVEMLKDKKITVEY